MIAAKLNATHASGLRSIDQKIFSPAAAWKSQPHFSNGLPIGMP
jgi:hypothetical protein